MEISSSMLKSMRTLWFTNKKLFLNSNDSPKNIKSLVQKFNQHYTVFWKSRKSFRKLSKSRFRPNQISRSMRRRHKSNNKTTQLKSSYWIWFYTLKYIINMHLTNMKTKGLMREINTTDIYRNPQSTNLVFIFKYLDYITKL